MTLTEFVAARLDEKEQTARYAGPARVAWLTLLDGDGQLAYTTVAAGSTGDDDEPWVADGREITEAASVRIVYDPAAVLREVAAGRKVLAEHDSYCCPSDLSCGEVGGWYDAPGEPLCPTRRAFGSAWSDHPDYDPAWAPD